MGREPVAIKCRFINKVLFYIYIYKKKPAQCVYTVYLYPYIYLCEATGLCVWSLCLLCSHNCLTVAHCGDRIAVHQELVFSKTQLSEEPGENKMGLSPVWAVHREASAPGKKICTGNALLLYQFREGKEAVCWTAEYVAVDQQKLFSSLSRASSTQACILIKPFFALAPIPLHSNLRLPTPPRERTKSWNNNFKAVYHLKKDLK